MGRHLRLTLPVLIFLTRTAGSQSLALEILRDEVLATRLERIRPSNAERLAELENLFSEAGCSGERLSRQPVKGSKLPNLICSLPGKDEETIVVGAHFDFAGSGAGAIDNWSGASLLPSLFQSLQGKPRHYSLLFVGFTDEESGLTGSRFFVKQWFREKRPKIVAMINMDSLGTGPTQLWVSRADKRLVDIAARMAKSMNLPIAGSNVDQVGNSDSAEFAARKIPVLDVHSITQDTLSLLHSSEDTRAHLHFPSYRQSYRIVLGVLAYLGAQASTPDRPAAQP